MRTFDMNEKTYPVWMNGKCQDQTGMSLGAGGGRARFMVARTRWSSVASRSSYVFITVS
jgi:hypothetical protein